MASGDCVFCGAPVSSQGEHVLPRWLFARWAGQGPFTFFEGSEPIAKRNGKTERDQLARVMLPVCGVDSPSNCNGWLNDSFEVAGKPQVRAVLDALQSITGSAVVDFARWVTKTLLLHDHPLAVNSEIGHLDLPGRNALELPPPGLRGLRHTGQFPEDVSVWMAVVDPNGAVVTMPEFELVVLPDVHRPDGAGGKCGATTLGLSLPNDLMVTLQLISHPLIDIVHPFEASGQVTRLWPNPPAALDVTALPVLDAAGGRALNKWFAVGGASIGLQAGERWPYSTLARFLQPRGGPVVRGAAEAAGA
ncbi:hypothetical protein ABT093_40480 [Kitasatospora sp. NPDC002551]|uniref:hypothetical protein n=1 Tax=Kitasatospora sp. NPDC002551 TaxID=3154539 RepID=UPI00331F70B5